MEPVIWYHENGYLKQYCDKTFVYIWDVFGNLTYQKNILDDEVITREYEDNKLIIEKMLNLKS